MTNIITKYYTAVCSSGGLGTSKSKYVGYECAVASELLPNRARFHQAIHPESKMVYGDFTTKIDEIARLHIEKKMCWVFIYVTLPIIFVGRGTTFRR